MKLEQHQGSYAFCTYCPKICRFACPVAEATQSEATSTWAKMTLSHQVAQGQRTLDESSAKSLYACTGCMRCTQFCKHENPVADALFASREVAVAQGAQPKGAASTLASFEQAQNPFGRPLAPQLDPWRVDAPVRHALFPGCSTLTKRRELVEAAMTVSAAFGAPVGVSRAAAQCCGYPLYAAGAFDALKAHAKTLAAQWSSYPELVVLDPGCAYTLKVVYPQIGVSLGVRILTLVEVLAENLPHAPQLPVLDETVGYHDACHLGRGLGQYDAPRALLRRATKTQREAPSCKDQAGCSGGGGLLPRTWPTAAVEVARRQAQQVAPEKETVVSACPTSVRMFQRAGRNAEDLLLTLARWLKGGEIAQPAVEKIE